MADRSHWTIGRATVSGAVATLILPAKSEKGADGA